MDPLIISLLTGHLIGDFVLQWDWMVQSRKRIWVMLLHTAIVGGITAILAGVWSPLLWFAVWVSHLLVDLLKTWFGKDGARTFIFDQLVHVSLLFLVAELFQKLSGQSIWIEVLGVSLYLTLMLWVGGFVLCVFAGSVLISKAMKPIVKQVEIHKGLPNGGKWIGQMERALTYLLVLCGQPGAIGFLFATKSILRFGEIKEKDQKKEAEYIIIGTFMSFGWALLIAFGVASLLGAVKK